MLSVALSPFELVKVSSHASPSMAWRSCQQYLHSQLHLQQRHMHLQLGMHAACALNSWGFYCRLLLQHRDLRPALGCRRLVWRAVCPCKAACSWVSEVSRALQQGCASHSWCSHTCSCSRGPLQPAVRSQHTPSCKGTAPCLLCSAACSWGALASCTATATAGSASATCCGQRAPGGSPGGWGPPWPASAQASTAQASCSKSPVRQAKHAPERPGPAAQVLMASGEASAAPCLQCALCSV